MRGRRFFTRAGSPLAIVALVVAGCGSSGSSTLSKADLISKANAACHTANAGFKSVGSPPTAFASDPVAAAKYMDRLQPVLDRLLSELKALTPPASLKSVWNAYLGAVSQSTKLLDSADTKAHAKDRTGLADFNKANGLGPAIRQAATDLGAMTYASHD